MESILLHLLFLLLAIVFLWKGADWTVEKASILAIRVNVSQVTIGVTIIALGTSLPEFAATLTSALKQHGDLALANVVGSNIFNLGIILGLAAIATPLAVRRESLHRDGFLLLGISLFLLVWAGDGYLGRLAGMLLLLLLLVYIILLLRRYGKQRHIPRQVPKGKFTAGDGGKLLLGLTLVVCGGYLLIRGALGVGQALQLPEWPLGLTVTALGTSLPEIVISVASILKKKQDILFGNLLGSDIFNFAGVLGLACLSSPIRITGDALLGLGMLTAFYVLLLLFMRSDWRVTRPEGAILLVVGASRVIYFLL